MNFNPKQRKLYPFPDVLAAAKPYWWLVTAIWLVGFGILCLHGTYHSFTKLVAFNSPLLDDFFTFYTHVGDGLFAIALALILFLLKYRRIAFAIVFSFLLSGLFAQIGKKVTVAPRPSKYFTDIVHQPVHTLPVTNWGHTSFPSGHSATAFALLTMLLLFFPKSKWNLLWILLAFLAGYSRMYVASHFLDDVLAGASTGVFSAFICYIISLKIFGAKPRWFPG